MKIGMYLEGLKEFEQAIDRAERRFDKALRVATSKAAGIIERAAEENIHDVTGELRRHVVKRIWKRKPGFIGYLVGPLFPGATPQQRSYYGAWVEEGHKVGRRKGVDVTKLEHGTSEVPPHPWLRPAFDQNKARAEAEMARVFRDATEGRITESEAVAILEEYLWGGI